MANSLFLLKSEAYKVSIQYYKLAIGSLIWPSVNIWYDIPHLERFVWCYYLNSELLNLNFVIRIIRSLTGNVDLEIMFEYDTIDELIWYINSE